MTTIEIRPFEDDDLRDVVALVGLAMGSSRRFTFDEAYWRWKHFDNPFGRSPCLVAVSPTRGIVGVRAFMRWNWRRGRTIVRAVRAVDTAVHPEFQGRGLFSRMTKQLVEDAAAEGVCFVFNTPNQRSLPGYLKLGWRDLGRGTLWLKPLRPLTVAATALRAPAFVGSTGTWDVAGGPIETLLLHLEREPVRELRDEALATARTNDYLRWRYAINPSAAYRAWLARSSRGSAAIVVRGGQRGGLREALLCDIFLGRPLASVAIATSLIRELCSRNDAHYVAASTSGDPRVATALMLSGFIPLPWRAPRLTVRDLGGSVAPRALDELCSSIGDLELF